MARVHIYSSLYDEHKLHDAASDMGIDPDALAGKLGRLWAYVAELARKSEGEFTPLKSAVIARVMGVADVDSLVRHQWLDRVGEDGYRVHQDEKYIGQIVRDLMSATERMRRVRRTVPRTFGERSPNSTPNENDAPSPEARKEGFGLVPELPQRGWLNPVVGDTTGDSPATPDAATESPPVESPRKVVRSKRTGKTFDVVTEAWCSGRIKVAKADGRVGNDFQARKALRTIAAEDRDAFEVAWDAIPAAEQKFWDLHRFARDDNWRRKFDAPARASPDRGLSADDILAMARIAGERDSDTGRSPDPDGRAKDGFSETGC